MAKFLALMLFALPMQASVSLTVSVANISSTPQAGSYIRADLQNCIFPTILNSSSSVTTPQRFYLPANSTQATFTIPDNTTQIACSGNQLSYWTFTYIFGVTQTVIKSAELPPGTFNLANLANLTIPPWNPGVIQGPVGPQGPQGSPPPYFGLWTSSQTYDMGDTVSYANATYISLVDSNLANTPSSSPSFWSIYVDPSGVSINPSTSQTITQMSGTFLNLDKVNFYDGTLALGTAADTIDTRISRLAAGSVSVDDATAGDAAGSLKAAILNAGTGFKLNGAAPLNHILIGDGTKYVDGTIPAVSTNYQTVQSAGVSQTQQPRLNFLAPIACTNNVGNTSTDCSLSASGATAGTYVLPTVTVDSLGRVTSISSGALSRTCNSNGCYITYPDGTILQWGSIGGCGSGTAACNMAVTFPFTFTSTTNLSVTVAEVGGGHNNYTAGHDGPTTSGFNVQYAALVFVGGGGTNLPGTQTADWIAIGH